MKKVKHEVPVQLSKREAATIIVALSIWKDVIGFMYDGVTMKECQALRKKFPDLTSPESRSLLRRLKQGLDLRKKVSPGVRN